MRMSAGVPLGQPGFRSLQSRLRVALLRLRKPDPPPRARGRHRARGLCGAHRHCGHRVCKDADRLHPGAGPGLPHQGGSASPGATLDRTEKLVRRGIDVILGTTGIEHVAPFGGLDVTTFTVAPNAATIFSGLPSLYEHELPGVISNTVLADLRKRLSVIKDGYVVTIPPPPVQGLGSGFKMMLEDRGGLGPQALEKAARALVAAPNKDPTFASVFTLFNAGSPSIYAGIDRMKAEELGLTPSDIFSTLQVYPRLTIRQRLQVSRPHLSGQGTERRAIQAHSAGHPPSQSPQRIRRDGADRGGSPAAEQDDPLSRAALQLVSGCRGARGSGAGRRHRHGVAAHGGAGERGASEGHCVRVDRPRVPATAARHADPPRLRGRPLFVFLVLVARYEN